MALLKACNLVKGRGQIGPFFIFLEAISDFNMGFLQRGALMETLSLYISYFDLN